MGVIICANTYNPKAVRLSLSLGFCATDFVEAVIQRTLFPFVL